MSRSLRAVEGALLLVDATQGVQAQTMTVLDMAREAGLTIVPVINKIDSPIANVEETEDQIMKLLKCEREDILRVSGKTGLGVPELLEKIADLIPAPKEENNKSKQNVRGLIFDFEYSNHQGIIVYTRVLNGAIKKGDEIKFAQPNIKVLSELNPANTQLINIWQTLMRKQWLVRYQLQP